ncbi:phosphotransferase [bacterium]|nr:phosphotransferase [bacterium]
MNSFLIPDIAKKINLILKKEGLKAKIPPEEFIKNTKGGKHRYASLCNDASGKALIFYARIQKNKDAKRKTKKEAIFAQTLQKNSFRKKVPFLSFLPDYYKGKVEKDFEWFEREFIKEGPLGDNEKLKESLSKKKILKITNFLISLSKTKISYFKKIPLRSFPLIEYKIIPHAIKRLKEHRIVSKNELAKAEELTKKYFPLFKKEHKYLSHGDFNLGNIIFTKQKLKIIDWESMEINNFAYDIAYLFSHLWQARQWQRRFLIESYLSKISKSRKEKFKILLRGNLLFLAGGGFWAKPKEIKKSQINKRKKFFQKFTKASLQNFEKILSV